MNLLLAKCMLAVVPECFVDPETRGRRAAENLQGGEDTYNLTHDGGCGYGKGV